MTSNVICVVETEEKEKIEYVIEMQVYALLVYNSLNYRVLLLIPFANIYVPS
jgi:hypothetical protein